MIGMGFLSACSLEQRESGNQVRIQIDPSVLRASTARSRGMLQVQGGQQIADESALPPIGQYFLINVEGPGIPFIEPPGLPCIRIGIGASVLVPVPVPVPVPLQGTGVVNPNPIGPIELWVPVGAERKITLYEITLRSRQSNLPAFGASASQVFMSQGASLSGVPARHGEVVIPNLVAEQSVELERVTTPSAPFCPAQFQVPPVLSSGTLTLQNYRPWRNRGANFYKPEISGPLLFWNPETPPLTLRMSGEVMGTLSGTVLVVGNSSATSTSIFSTSVSSPNVMVGGSTSWFEEAYSVSMPDTYHHTVGGVNRSIPIQIAASHAPAAVASPSLVSGYSNVYEVKIYSPDSSSVSFIRPVARDAVFGVNANGFSRAEVVPPPSDLSSVANPAPPCPMEGTDSEPVLIPSGGCAIYIVVLKGVLFGENVPNAVLEVDIASGDEPTVFRRAQFDLGIGIFDRIPTQQINTILENRPTNSQMSTNPQEFSLDLGADQTVLEDPVFIRGEISGPGFRQEFEATDFQDPSLMPVTSSTARAYLVTQPANECITRVSLLVTGKLENSSNILYRRETFNLPMCDLPSAPQLVSVVQFNSPSVRVSWNPGDTVGASSVPLQFEVFRKAGSDNWPDQPVHTCLQTGSTGACAVNSGMYSYTDSTTTPGTLYSYKVRARSVSSGSASQLSGLFSEVKSITPIGAVALSSQFMISPGVWPSPLKAFWNAVPGATEYLVLIRPTGSGNFLSANLGATNNPISVSSSLNGEAPSAMINGLSAASFLTPGTTYDIKIQAIDAFGNFRESDIVQAMPMDLPYITEICRSSTTDFRFVFSRDAAESLAVRGLNTAQVYIQPFGGVESSLGSPVNGYAAGGAFSIDFPQSGIPTTAISPMELRVKISNSNGFLYSKFATSAGSITDYFVYYPGMAISPCP
jgi:hypothetical protein